MNRQRKTQYFYARIPKAEVRLLNRSCKLAELSLYNKACFTCEITPKVFLYLTARYRLNVAVLDGADEL